MQNDMEMGDPLVSRNWILSFGLQMELGYLQVGHRRNLILLHLHNLILISKTYPHKYITILLTNIGQSNTSD